MRKQWKVISALVGGGTLLVAGTALAQSGHFIEGGGGTTCTDTGTTMTCVGKVAGLGGTTFEIVVEAPGTAVVECINPAGNRAPGQDTSIDATGTTDPQPTPRNGQYRFRVSTDTPSVADSACPNPQWTPVVIDVEFGDATISLYENGSLSDQITVPVE